ncbi:MAG TPA: hypothetical protein VGM94_15140 [Galbitalea sp.]|jgi:hypothetical protein
MFTPRSRGVQVVIDPTEWMRLKRDLDKFDPALTRALRKRIRNAGNVAAEAVKKKLREETPGGNPSGPGRQALIDATRVTVSFGKRSAGTRIVTSSSKLAPEHQGLLNVYNKETFRHPVFGNTEVWEEQQGREYFSAAIKEVMGTEITNEIRAALDEAVTAIGGRGR